MARARWAPSKGLVTIRVDGIEKTLKRLDGVKLSIRKRVLRKAVRAGFAPTVKAGKRNAPVETRELKRKITQRVKTAKSRDAIESQITAFNKKGARGRNPVRYLHIVHDGAMPHAITGSLRLKSGDMRTTVQHPGYSGNPFLRRAFVNTQKDAVNAFAKKFEAETMAELAKMGKP